MPVSSAHCALGNTTSANAAVSERKKSDTARKSSAWIRSVTCAERGAETTMFDAITHSARTPPSVPSRSSIS